MSRDDLLRHPPSLAALNEAQVPEDEVPARMEPHSFAGRVNPGYSSVDEVPPPARMVPTTPPLAARRPMLKLSTISGTVSAEEHYSSLPGSPRSSRISGVGNAPLRRAALLLRASRSSASLQGTWPPPAPSRSQSLTLQQTSPGCCCCGTPDTVTTAAPSFDRTFSRSSATEDPCEGQKNPDGSLTPVGLSWRRLHVSRAKLKATATTSELLSGFAMVAMVELQINQPTNVPEWLFILFSVCTTVLVAVHIFALMISTYILPNIDAITRLHSSELISESPHEKMRWFIELAWGFSTVLGLFLFLVEVAILCWVKFWDYSFAAAVASTVIVVPALAVFVGFAVHFYHSLVVHKCEASDLDLQRLEQMKQQLDTFPPPSYSQV